SELGGITETAWTVVGSSDTALVASVMPSVLSTLVLPGVLANPIIPDSRKADEQSTFGAGVPFLSDTAVRMGLEAYGAAEATTQEVLQINADARLAALRAALFVVVLAAALALFFTRRIPTKPPGAPAMIPDGKETPALQDQPE